MNYLKLERENDLYYFIDSDGKRSENFYFADEYKDGYALVQREENGLWKYRDLLGNLSEEYFMAEPYQYGIALIRKGEKSPYNFIDIYGKKSEDYVFATRYNDGYALVQKEKKGKQLFRDVFGKTSEEKTEVGDIAYEYMSGKIEKKDIPRHFFFDESFRLKVLSEEVRRDKLKNLND